MDTQVYKRLHPREYLDRYLGQSIRPDGRGISTARRAALSVGIVGSAVGSAMAKIGRTTVTAGVQATLSSPAPASPSSGSVELEVHILPLTCGPTFGTGGYKAELRKAGVKERVCIEHFLRSNAVGQVDLDELCVEEGLLVWNLSITLYCLDDDGCLEDAFMLATLAALQNTRLPGITLIDEDAGDGDGELPDASTGQDQHSGAIAVASRQRNTRLTVLSPGLSATFALIEEHVIIDPTHDEEAVADGILVLVMNLDGTLRSMEKSGRATFGTEHLSSCLKLAEERLKVLRDLLADPRTGD